MASIIELEIKNFRGIKNFKIIFEKGKNFVCLVGRGDSGKTTILEAISYVLSPAWNLTFYDTDFYDCDCCQNIEIEVTLINFPDELLSENRYGLWQKGYDPRSQTISDEIGDGKLPALSIRLTVGQNLEPKWEVVNNRQQENKPISTTDRAKLNCFMVSDYVDRHFSWNKGNPLYSLLKINDGSFDDADKNVVLDAIRNAKDAIDKYEHGTLKNTTENVINQASALGLDITKSKTSVDFRDISFHEGRICLHDDKIPFRLKGKGSKRLISIAIQMSLAKHGGIILIDEIEQGLEPDRIKLLARTLKHNGEGQIFITTHSCNAITEIDVGDIVVIHSDKKNEITVGKTLDCDNDKLQATVRACPEAFFAKKIIVCEGATEIGICRALDRYRQNNGKHLMSFNDCAYIDGTGSNFIYRAKELKDVGFEVAVLCDSDRNDVNSKKDALRAIGILLFDCEDDLPIEYQIFKDLPWNGVKELVEYAQFTHYQDKNAIEAIIKEKFGNDEIFPENWLETDTNDIRMAIGNASAKRDNENSDRKEWFKRIDHGEVLGNVIFKYFDEMDEEIHLKKMFTGLSIWIGE